MMRFNKATVFALASLMLAASVAPGQGKKEKIPPTDTQRLQAEIDHLRMDLDAALREIAAMKAGMNGGKTIPDEGQLFRGRPARYWLEQLKDADEKTRETAIEAIGGLARKDKKLIPVLLDTFKTDPSEGVTYGASSALVAIGPAVVPALAEIAKDKSNKDARVRAIQTIGYMRAPDAKAAVPLLAKTLAETDVATLRATVWALHHMGPDAKEAIPDLVNALGDSITDAGKPANANSRFGVSREFSGTTPINVMILDALFFIDPELREVVTQPRIGSKKKGGGGATTAKDALDAWMSVHETLVKRYGKTK